MLKIGVISDTHLQDLKEASKFVDRLMTQYFAKVDMILHAGDLVNPMLLDLFLGVPVHAVRGNMDPSISGLPVKKIIQVGCFKIGLMHGWGNPETLEKRVREEFRNTAIDCLVYGHSHRPVCHLDAVGMLLFNPGSATDRRSAPAHTVGMLEVGPYLRGRIISID